MLTVTLQLIDLKLSENYSLTGNYDNCLSRVNLRCINRETYDNRMYIDALSDERNKIFKGRVLVFGLRRSEIIHVLGYIMSISNRMNLDKNRVNLIKVSYDFIQCNTFGFRFRITDCTHVNCERTLYLRAGIMLNDAKMVNITGEWYKARTYIRPVLSPMEQYCVMGMYSFNTVISEAFPYRSGITVGCHLLSIIRKDRRLHVGLISEHNGKPFGLLGGKVEPDESRTNCLLRESLEELGYIPDCVSCVVDRDFRVSISSCEKFRAHYVVDIGTEINGLTYFDINYIRSSLCNGNISPYVTRILNHFESTTNFNIDIFADEKIETEMCIPICLTRELCSGSGLEQLYPSDFIELYESIVIEYGRLCSIDMRVISAVDEINKLKSNIHPVAKSFMDKREYFHRYPTFGFSNNVRILFNFIINSYFSELPSFGKTKPFPYVIYVDDSESIERQNLIGRIFSNLKLRLNMRMVEHTRLSLKSVNLNKDLDEFPSEFYDFGGSNLKCELDSFPSASFEYFGTTVPILTMLDYLSVLNGKRSSGEEYYRKRVGLSIYRIRPWFVSGTTKRINRTVIAWINACDLMIEKSNMCIVESKVFDVD